jgi:hypothetical protein
MEPISQKAGASRLAGTAQRVSDEQKDVQKSGPSKFDMLRADLNQKLAASAQPPAHVAGIDDQHKKLLENDLRRKLETARNPQELFGGDMKQLRTGIADLNRQVARIPDVSAFAPLRERLKSIESDFNASARLLKNTKALDDPKQLLQMQMEIYKLAHNVEIMAKTMSEVASGVKTILQQQV